ncbi:MAG: hypothetical protein LM587_02870 [Candidatus Aenigmarchaeota archaeon]|jgi:hypothetical protein|nr:hypothetical protein [Candidatus Aenigmarchaeota archaeon]
MKIPFIEKLFQMFKDKENERRLKNLKERVCEAISLPTILLFGLLVRVLTSFVSWIKALLISWGVFDGILSNYIYREEKFFPYQFLRYGRIIANLSGIVSPIIPMLWNISDGICSMIIYERAHPVENFSRLGRVLNGVMFVAFG